MNFGTENNAENKFKIFSFTKISQHSSDPRYVEKQGNDIFYKATFQ